MKQKLIELKRQIDKPIVIFDNFNTLSFATYSDNWANSQ